MPSDTSAEQVELRRKGRQRLIGAVVLALLAVVFVPMLLDPEPRRERSEPLLAIPPKDAAAPLAAPTSPPGSPAAAKIAGTDVTALPAPPAPAPATAPQARRTVEPRSSEFKPSAPKSATQKTEAKAAPKLEGFAVQVGAFKDEARLAHAREKLAAAGIAHFIDRQPDFTRLRAGPYPTREAAEKAAVQVKRAGLDGRVVPLP